MQVNGLGEKRKYLSFLRTSIFFIVHIVYLQFSGVFQENQVFLANNYLNNCPAMSKPYRWLQLFLILPSSWQHGRRCNLLLWANKLRYTAASQPGKKVNKYHRKLLTQNTLRNLKYYCRCFLFNFLMGYFVTHLLQIL